MENQQIFRSSILILLLATAISCEKKSKDASARSEFVKTGYKVLQKADSLRNLRLNDSALASYTAAIREFEKAQDSVYTVYAFLKIADIQKEYNDFAEMQASTIEARKYVKPTDSLNLSTVYNNLGITYAQTADPHKAIWNYTQSLNVTSDPVSKITLKNNIANVYINQQNYEQAHQILSTLSSASITDRPDVHALVTDNLGYAAFALGKPEADSLLQAALRIRLQNSDRLGAIASYIHLMESNESRNRTLALKYAHEAYSMARIVHAADDRLIALRFLATNAPPEARHAHSMEFIALSDSLSSARRAARHAYADVKYNFRAENEKRLKAERDRAQLKLSAAEQENATLRWRWIATLLIGIVLLGLYFGIRRQKKIRRKVSYDTEVRISKMLHDGLANEMHRAIVFAETRDLSESQNKELLLGRLEDLYSGARSISHHTGEVPASEDFGKFLKDLLSEYNSEECTVLAQGLPEVDWHKIERYKRVELSRVIQELLANMRKHSDCTHAFFSFARKRRKLSVTYSDNGRGTSADTQKRKNGLRIMENRISGLGGTVTFDSEPGKGFRAQIEISI